MRRLLTALTTSLLLVLSACAAPPTGDAHAATPVATDAPAQQTVPAQTPVKIDRSCRRDADCAVKDVGNCCGYYPACVNVDSPTDPAGVRAQCARSGQVSICGFRDIQGCQCVQGQCQDRAAPLEVQ